MAPLKASSPCNTPQAGLELPRAAQTKSLQELINCCTPLGFCGSYALLLWQRIIATIGFHLLDISESDVSLETFLRGRLASQDLHCWHLLTFCKLQIQSPNTEHLLLALSKASLNPPNDPENFLFLENLRKLR